MITINNWIEWFDSRDSSTFVNKQAQEELFQAFNFSSEPNDCKKKLIDHQEVLFLFKESFEEKLSVFHHLVEIGGTVYDTEIEIGFIQGTEDERAIPMTPNTVTLLEKPDTAAVAVPTITNLLAVTSITDIENLTVSSSTYKPRNFIPITPFLCKVVSESIETTKGNYQELLLAVVKEIKNFDTKFTGNAEYTNKAKQKCKDLLFWIYLAGIEESPISAIPTTINTSQRVREKLNGVTTACIGKKDNNASNSVEFADAIGAQLKRPLEIIATSNSNQSDLLRSLHTQNEKLSEKSSRAFTKLPSHYQNMILVASSQGEVTAMELNEQAIAFFKCPNQLSANVMLNCLLETKQIDCSISSAMTQALMCGCFLWRDAITPSGFASSAIMSEDSIRTDTLHQGMVLDLSTKFEMSKDSLEKLTKTNIAYPTTIEGLIKRLKALKELSIFFLTEYSYASQGLTLIVLKFMDNKPLLRARALVDDEFIPKVLCCIDDRVYQWFKQCAIATYVGQTTAELMNFGDVFLKILTNEFHYNLPANVKKLKRPNHTPSDNLDLPQKRAKQTSERIVNPSCNESWKIRQNEQWETVFRHKSVDGPLLSMNCHPCLKYHCKGWCFSDCKNKASHINLKNEDKAKTSAFIKSLRGE